MNGFQFSTLFRPWARQLTLHRALFSKEFQNLYCSKKILAEPSFLRQDLVWKVRHPDKKHREYFLGGGWFTWNIVNEVYILIKGKKSINAEKNENFELTHCRLPSGYKTQTENLKSFFVWYVKTCHRTTHRASRNRFAAISFHNYLHYFGIFLAHFSMKIDRNIISSLHIVFSLCARVGWCDVCTDFTNVIKVDENVDVNEMSLLNK